ncbi:MAG: RidA family protein [Candidatus Krumholzibacteria bacterium]
MDILQPPGWKRPSGYSNGIKAEGETVFVAGQIGWDENCQLVGDSFTDQVRQALANVVAVLGSGGAKREHIVRMTWYVADLDEYRSSKREVGRIYREVIGDHYPVMTLFEVSRLYDEGAKVEIEATAVIPRAK